MGCGASVQRFQLEESVPFERQAGNPRSVDVGNGIYRKAGFEAALIGVPPDKPEVKTAWDVIQRSAKDHSNVNCIGVRTFEPGDPPKGGEDKIPGKYAAYKWTTYQEFCQLSINFGMGIVSIFELGVGAHVGIYGPSLLTLLVAQYGCWSQAITTTPMYDTWSPAVLQHVIGHADLEVMVVAQPLLGKIHTELKAKPSKVRGCIVLPHPEYAEKYDKEMDKAEGRLAVHSYQNILERGLQPGGKLLLPEPDADAVIMYTSGSSGLPKGVQLPHSGFVGVAQGLRQASGDGMKPGIVVACFLPLGHIYPTSVVLASFLGGCSTGLYHGDATALVDDLQAMKPNVIPGVPRVYQNIYTKAVDSLKQRNFLVQGKVDSAIKTQTANVRAGRARDAGLDKKIFSKMQETLGGEVKYFTTGASKILPTLSEWMKVCFDAYMAEGYGLTESYGCAILQEAEWNTFGDVGAPLCCTEIRLQDVPDFGYSSKGDPPRGELCLRGINIMRGYYKDEEQTAQELKEGWLHTGDVAQRNIDGTFSIIDRISNVFKLGRAVEGVEGAVLIAPEVIENQLATCELINQAWIFGSTNYPQLLAVIVPDAGKLLKKAGSSLQFKSAGWQEEVVKICASGDAEKWIVAEVNALVNAKKIKPWEEPARIHVESKLDQMGLGFTVDNELLTNTFKLRRGILKKHYSEVLIDLYKSINIEWKK